MNNQPRKLVSKSDYASRLATHSLQVLPWGNQVKCIIEAALHAVEPGKAILRWMTRNGNTLTVAGQEYHLQHYRRVFVVGAGKAAAPMGIATADILGPYFSIGILITKDGYKHNLAGQNDLPGLFTLEAGHPLPDERGVYGARCITDLISGAEEDDLVVCLISGGGSALLPSPVSGISLADLQELTSILLACGATINEINTLRKHLDTLKGGGMARLAAPATLITLVLSDVVGDRLDVIASGPCVPDPTTFADAYNVLERYGIIPKVPTSVVSYLRRGLQGEIPETPKPGDAIFNKVNHVIVGSNRLAAETALEQARKEGFHAMILTTTLQGEACEVGRQLGGIAIEIANCGKPISRPACLIAGGETTVTIHGNGKGGRNQELALGAVDVLAGLDNIVLVTLATDGGDGPTDAAGAVVTGETRDRALYLGHTTVDYLDRNDSYHFFESLDDLLIPGPTETNVNDLTFIFVA